MIVYFQEFQYFLLSSTCPLLPSPNRTPFHDQIPLLPLASNQNASSSPLITDRADDINIFLSPACTSQPTRSPDPDGRKILSVSSPNPHLLHFPAFQPRCPDPSFPLRKSNSLLPFQVFLMVLSFPSSLSTPPPTSNLSKTSVYSVSDTRPASFGSIQM
jgi:hypothetical protein